MAIISRYVRQTDGVWEEDFFLREVPTMCAEGHTSDPDLIIVELGGTPPPLPEEATSIRDTLPDL